MKKRALAVLLTLMAVMTVTSQLASANPTSQWLKFDRGVNDQFDVTFGEDLDHRGQPLARAKLQWRDINYDSPELDGVLGLNRLPAGDCARLHLVYSDIDGNYVDEQYGPEVCSPGEDVQQQGRAFLVRRPVVQTPILLPGPQVAGIRSVDVHLQVKTDGGVWETQRTRSRTRPF